VSESVAEQEAVKARLFGFFMIAAAACVVGPGLAVRFGAEEFVIFVAGAFVGLNGLPVIWAALRTERLGLRFVVTFVIVGVFLFNLLLGLTASNGWPPSVPHLWRPFFLLPLIFLITQSPLWIMRAAFGWRIIRTDVEPSEPSGRSRQFGIRELLIVTAVIALAFAMARWALTDDRTGRIEWWGFLWPLLATFFWSLLVAPPTVWFTFKTTHLLAVGVKVSLYTAFVIVLVSGIAMIAAGGRVAGELVLAIALFHIGVLLVLWSGLALLRHLGFSLVLEPV